MKKLLYLLLFIPLVFACSDDSNSEDVYLEIGDIHQGGIIFSLDASGHSGLIAAIGDLGVMNWGAARGHESDDWYLPSVYELQTMYNTIGQGAAIPYYNIGDFASGSYWSDVEGSVFNFTTGNSSSGWNGVLNFRVRFISSF
jgi:hypothetical protein